MGLDKIFSKSITDKVAGTLAKSWKNNKKIDGVFNAVQKLVPEKGYTLEASDLVVDSPLPAVERSLHLIDERSAEKLMSLTVKLNAQGEYTLHIPDEDIRTEGPNGAFSQIHSWIQNASDRSEINWTGKLSRVLQAPGGNPNPKAP